MNADIQFLKDRGISSPYAVAVMPHHVDESTKGIVLDYSKLTADKIAQDAAMSSVPNIGVPAALVTYIDPTITTILFGAMNATKLFGEEVRKGSWTDQYMNFPVEEISGDVTPYSDFTDNVSSDVNYSFPSRQNFLFQTTMKYGLRESEVAGKARLELAGAKQRAAASILARAHNRFYLYGVAGKQVIGALNDPNLNASLTPVSVNSKTTWSDKVADTTNAGTVANVIYNDVAKLVNELMGNNAGNVDQNTKFVLAVASDRYSYLQIPNSFGITALQMLKSNYPNMEVIQLPELATASGSMLYLSVPELFGEPTAECAFSEKMRMGTVEVKTTSFLQKAFGGTWGCVIRRPNLVSTMTGI